ncbi:GNAT family N-acetyltransferase [Staphylococcus saprophyticus]|uniref:GNAT family N-acetyltransferase n=1 Tax=Staphylococcus saprophyticus TaxID=29385 RepID=UPI00398B1640
MLESKRLIMTKPQLSYSEELYEIHSNKIATQYTPKRRHKTINDTKNMLNKWITHWDDHNYGYFVIIKKENKKVIGSGGAEKMEFANKEYFNLYYRLDPKETGNGYATEAIKTIINWLKTKIDNNLDFVIRTDVNNISSVKLAEKLGFKKDSNFDNYVDQGDIFFFK